MTAKRSELQICLSNDDKDDDSRSSAEKYWENVF